METILTILVFSFLVTLIWKEYKKYLIQKFKYRLFELRDKLRDNVIKGNINKNNWAFDYIDSSISKSINGLDGLNLWRAILLFSLHRKDERLNEFRANFNKQLEKNNNLSLIYTEYGQLITRYILSKHGLTFTISAMGLLPVIMSAFMIKQSINMANKAVKELRNFPETSTSNDFQFCH